MPSFNGRDLNADAFRIATAIKTATTLQSIPDNYNIAAVKADLRRLYVATGGDRGRNGYDPSTQELRDVYNGVSSGAELLAKAQGREVPKSGGQKVPEVMVEDDESAAAAKLLAQMLGGKKLDPEAVKKIAVDAVNGRVSEIMSSLDGLIADEVAKSIRKVEVTIADLPKVEIENAHKAFERVLRYAANGKSVMLVGPAGSGKTTLAEQIAKAMGRDFYATGKVSDPFQLTGFIDANGGYRRTSFRDAYEKGGIFLFDEMDGSAPDAIVAFNAPLAGNWGDFPDGMVKRHPDFVAIAAANTYGRGADRQYVGREQLDAATLDRFAVIEVDYDEDLEMAIACDADWTKYVQKVRAAVAKEKVRHIVSPRASIDGGIMLKAGESKKNVEDAYIWKGLDIDVKNRVLAAMR